MTRDKNRERNERKGQERGTEKSTIIEELMTRYRHQCGHRLPASTCCLTGNYRPYAGHEVALSVVPTDVLTPLNRNDVIRTDPSFVSPARLFTIFDCRSREKCALSLDKNLFNELATDARFIGQMGEINYVELTVCLDVRFCSRNITVSAGYSEDKVMRWLYRNISIGRKSNYYRNIVKGQYSIFLYFQGFYIYVFEDNA